MKCVWVEAYVLYLNIVKFRIVYYKQFLDKCGFQKNCWLDDDNILEEVWVMSALSILCIVFEVKNICCTVLPFMCSLFVLYFKVLK